MKSPRFLFGLLLLISCQTVEQQAPVFTSIPFPGKGDASLPVLSSNGENLLFSFVEEVNDSTAALFYSQLEGDVFSQASQIHEGTDWFVNWADFPAIVENKGNLLAHILRKSSAETFSYDVNLQVLPKGQDSWQTNLPLHSDSTFTEHGFVSMMTATDSTYFISWLDGRNTGGGHDHSGGGGAMSIRAAELDLQGNVRWEELLDAKTCDCCQTSVAMSSQGPVVVYRNRSDREIRDIAITRLVDGKWTEPRIIHADGWEIRGCPVNGPKVAAKEETVVVAWFTDVNLESQVKLAFSTDAGATFDAPQKIGLSGDLGRVDVALLDQENALVSWMGMENDSTFLMLRRVNKQGDEFQSHRVALMDPSRKSGFPQMEVHQNKVYFAWTIIEEQGESIGMAVVNVADL